MVNGTARVVLYYLPMATDPQRDQHLDSDDPSDESTPDSGTWWSGHVELFSVLLIALTAVLTAWSSFESSRWGAEMSIEFNSAGAARTESLRASNQADQQMTIDIGIFVDYVHAKHADDDALADFMLARMPDRLAVATDAWLATDPFTSADAPSTPMEMSKYVIPAMDKADALTVQADEHSASARRAAEFSDNYMITSVFFASVILLAALSTKVGGCRLQMSLLGTAVVIFAITTAVVISYPVEF